MELYFEHFKQLMHVNTYIMLKIVLCWS